MLSRCSTRSASLGKAGSSSRAGPIEATRPSAVTRSPSSKNSKLSGSSPDPGSERKWRIAPRCARTPPALSMWGATLDPGEHFGSLLLGDAGHVAYGHGTRGELLTYLVGPCQDALGCIDQPAVRSRGDPRQGRSRGVTASAAALDDRIDADDAPGGGPSSSPLSRPPG